MQLLMIESKNIRLRPKLDPKRGKCWVCVIDPKPEDVRLRDIEMFGWGPTKASAYLALFRVLASQGWAVVVMRSRF